MAARGKTLTALGSYWKGRKPLILNKACILGCLLPATDDPARDLEIFEKLMAMDDESFVARWQRRSKPKEILATLSIARSARLLHLSTFILHPSSLPLGLVEAGIRRREGRLARGHHRSWNAVGWKHRCSRDVPYRDRVDKAKRAEEVMDTVHDHIWDAVNGHLGTSAPVVPGVGRAAGHHAIRPPAHVWPTPSAVPARFPSRPPGSAATSTPPISTQWPACSPGARSTSSAAPRKPRETGERPTGTGSQRAGGDRPARRRDRWPRLASQGVSLLRGSSLPAERAGWCHSCRPLIVSTS